jgi:hypothetical protein
VSILAIALVGLAAVGATVLTIPAARRTGLGLWHPAIAWLALEVVFFAAGSVLLVVIDGATGPATYVAGALAAFGLAVWASSELAARRARRTGAAEPRPWAVDPGATGIDGLRPIAVAVLAVLGVAALLPTLIDVGIPFLTRDITGARSEVGGLELQLLRVTLPAAVLVAILRAAGSTDGRTRLVAIALTIVAIAAELALASRYLAAELIAAIVLGLAIGGHPVSRRLLAVIGLAVIVLFAGVGILRAYDQAAGRELAFALERTVNRVLLIEPRTLGALQAAIPADQPFFDGLTWLRRLAPLVGRDDVPNLGYWIYPHLFPDQATAGYAAPGLLGEAWANFGWLGLGLFGLLGVAVERLGALMSVRRRTVADLVAAALLTLFVARTHALGLNGLAILVAIVAVWRVLAAPVDGLMAGVRDTLAWRV